MDRVGGLAWRMRSLWCATLAGFGIHPRRSAMPMYVRVPGPFWRRWWSALNPPPPLPADYVAPPPPPWAGPPESELGVAVPARTVLASQPNLVIALTDCVAYSNGFTVGIAVRSRHFLDHRSVGFGPPMERPDDSALQIAIKFADGREGAASGHGPSPDVMAYYRAWRDDQEPPRPAGPIVSQMKGGGGGKRWDFEYWVWPLPLDGPLMVSCQWRSEGVALTSTQLGGTAIRLAGSTSKSVWD